MVSDVEVTVLKGGREIDRILRPLRDTDFGPAVTYRRQLWPYRDGAIYLDGEPAAELPVSVSPDPIGHGAETGEDLPQAVVIRGAAGSRLLVDAAPGTGKTHVACALVAALVANGVPAARIWLISFTRTAVVEMRNRIALALDNPAEAASVRIATLDSHAWALQSGFSSDVQLAGFNDNIERTLEKIEEDEDLRDYLGRVRHLVIDEAQDIVGVRADLMISMIGALDGECGVTVFADEAQAIYGFTEEPSAPGPSGPTLPDRLRALGFQEIALTRVHRTSRATLKTIFTNVRSQVLRRNGSATARRRRVDHEIRRLADEDAGALRDLKLAPLPESALVLMRNRAEVLLTSSMQSDTPHRLRMSGLPSSVHPWIGALLWDHVDPRLTRTVFDNTWEERLSAGAPGGTTADHAWQMLTEVAGETSRSVDVRQLRTVLGRSSPPMLFCAPEFGGQGPILGTIHASKGREADEVLLYLPSIDPDGEEQQDADEEIRVMFVGATRVREYLRVGTGGSIHAQHAEGRCWRWLKPKRVGGHVRKRVQIEVGRSGDLDCAGLVGRRAFSVQADAEASQKRWLSSAVCTDLHARSEADLDWDYVLEGQANQRLGLLSARFKAGLREIARQCERFPPPGFLPHLRSVGSRTVAVRPDDPQLELLHEPWRSSGFLLAPLLTGFSAATFPGA
jgi:hypothetical protein